MKYRDKVKQKPTRQKAIGDSWQLQFDHGYVCVQCGQTFRNSTPIKKCHGTLLQRVI